MEYGTAFTFMFADPNWLRKLGFGTLVLLLGIVLSPILIGFIPILMVMGYSLDVTRNVIRRDPFPLPEWDDWGGFLVRGLRLFGAMLIWSLLLFVIAIPLVVGSGLLGSDNSGAQVTGGLLLTCGICLSILWGIFIFLISPAIYIRLAKTERFGAAFQVGILWQITRKHLGPVIISLILVWVAGLIAGAVGLLGVVLCCIGLFVTIPAATLWQYLVMGHLFGQIGTLGRPDGDLELVPFEPAPEAPLAVTPESAPWEPEMPEPAPADEAEPEPTAAEPAPAEPAVPAQ